MNTNGNANPNTTDDGLLKIEIRLAFVIENIALNWLYCFMGVSLAKSANVLEKFYFAPNGYFHFFAAEKNTNFARTLKTKYALQSNIIFLATGSNLGDRKACLLQAQKLITGHIGEIIAASSIFETAPWGNENQPDFYNQVLKVKTSLTPDQLMDEILKIETLMGRKRSFRYAPREIDIDILFYNDEIIKENGINIPHPFLQKRNFVLAPLMEVAPRLMHPVLRKEISMLALECPDLLSVKKINDG